MRFLAPTLILASLSLAACNPCAERCRVESRNIEDCLDDWNLEWADFGATNAKSFSDQCVETELRWIDSLEGDEKQAETSACWDLTEELRSAGDCTARCNALVSYGNN